MPSGASKPKRLTAVAAAGAVTLLTLAGAVGIGPGAALAESPSTSDSAREALAATAADETTAISPALESAGRLTIDDPRQHSVDPDSSGARGSERNAERKLPPRSGEGKRVVYDISDQRVWLVSRKDSVARTYPVSGGLDEQLLEPGHYAVYSKSRYAVSFDDRETMNYMVRFAYGERSAIGFHDIPAFHDGTLAQSRSELGTPQSAGCIRQWITDAKALWEFSSLKTPVVVTA